MRPFFVVPFFRVLLPIQIRYFLNGECMNISPRKSVSCSTILLLYRASNALKMLAIFPKTCTISICGRLLSFSLIAWPSISHVRSYRYESISIWPVTLYFLKCWLDLRSWMISITTIRFNLWPLNLHYHYSLGRLWNQFVKFPSYFFQ